MPKTRKFCSSVRNGCSSECAAISASAYSLAHMRISSCCGFVFAQHWVILNRNLERTGYEQHACGVKIRTVPPSFLSAALSSNVLLEQASTSRSLCNGSSLAPVWGLFEILSCTKTFRRPNARSSSAAEKCCSPQKIDSGSAIKALYV